MPHLPKPAQREDLKHALETAVRVTMAPGVPLNRLPHGCRQVRRTRRSPGAARGGPLPH
jgi:hypothetical protein